MTHPNAPSRETVAKAKEDLAHLPGVESVAVRPVGEHEHGNRRLVSVVLPADVARTPPAVLRTLARHDLGIADVTPQGEQLIVAAV